MKPPRFLPRRGRREPKTRPLRRLAAVLRLPEVTGSVTQERLDEAAVAETMRRRTP